ncbi:MAG: glycosyltransferase, partial [Planctomycetota bacterium]
MTILVLYVIYWLAAFGLFVYGINCYILLRSYRKGRDRGLERIHRIRREYWAGATEEDLPTVTIQLPLYNERFVAGRLLHAVAQIDYPRHLLEVQVLDDSTDETVELVREHVDHF